MVTYLTFDDVLLKPSFSDIKSRKDVNASTYIGQWLLSVPIISANMDTITGPKMANEMARLGGIGALHRFCSIEQAITDFGLAQKSFVSLGTKDYKERSQALYNAGARSFIVDIAHGHSSNCGDVVKYLRDMYDDSYIMAGNVATSEGYSYLRDCGADGIKVGIGPGGACTTRIMTGCGVPQLSAILDAREAQDSLGGDLIADGGIRTPGDAVKALAAGATAIMAGRIFAGCDETPTLENLTSKIYRGSASAESNLDNGTDGDWKTAEGVTMIVNSIGPLENVIKKFMGGIRSGMSYCGAKNLLELRARANFIEISNNARIESDAHGRSL